MPHERRLHWVVKLVTVALTVLLLWLPLNGDDFTASPSSAASTENDTGEPGGSFRVTCASLVAVDPRIEDGEKQGFWVVEPEGIRLTEIGRSAAASECADRRSRTLVWMVLLAVPVAALWSTWVADARARRRPDPDSPVS